MIAISRPSIGSEEVKMVTQSLLSGKLAQGALVEELEKEFATYCDTKYAVAVNSGTAAIHTILQALEIEPGDEVIVPAFTFIASASPVIFCGAKVIFCDISASDFCISAEEIAKHISLNTKAVITVDLFGQICDYKKIKSVCGTRISIVEDACQSIGATQDGKKSGSSGKAAAFSLYATKNITSGEGGMITTSSKLIMEKCKRFRNHGQEESKRYDYIEIGYNYRMTDFQAALALAQIKKVENFTAKRILNAQMLSKGLQNIPGLILPSVKPNSRHVFHQYVLRVKENIFGPRSEFVAYLKKNGIFVGIHYPIPLPFTSYFSNMGYRKGDFPVAESMSREVVSLPVHPGLTKKDINYIIETISRYAKNK